MNGLEKVYASIIERASAPPDPHPGDFRSEDGIIYCGVCRKPRQKDQELLGTVHRVRVACQCEIDQQNREKEEEQIRRRKDSIAETMAILHEMGAADYPKGTFARNDGRSKKNSMNIARYASRFDQVYDQNIGLMLYGEAGSGKTFFAECIANALLDQGRFAWMTSIREIAGSLSANYGDNRPYLLRMVENVDLLILDDFGAERDTGYMIEQVYEIINTRYKAGRPLVVTTNLSPQQMAQESDIKAKRIYERVMEMCTPLLVEGHTRRKANASEKTAALKSILEA